MTSTPTDSPEHSKISFTAKLVAYGRRLSDIPFADEVADLVQAEAVFDRLLAETGIKPHDLDWMAPMVEARYKCINAALQRSGVTQVLEFASGVSLRGLMMSQDPQITYVETDLPGITEEKLRIVDKVRAHHQLPDYGNLFFHATNILSWPEIENALAHFASDKPVAVIHEGLFPYLTLAEKEVAARNIHKILARFGGLWITPDLNARDDMQSEFFRQGAMAALMKKIGGATQRDFEDRVFADEEEVRQFLTRMGFRMCVLPQMDGSYELTTVERLHLSPEKTQEMSRSLKLWEMTPQL